MEVLLNCGKRDTSVLDFDVTGDRGSHEISEIMTSVLTTQQDRYNFPHTVNKETELERFGGLS